MLGSHGIRTDLALEATERFTEENVEVRGVEVTEDYNEEKDIRTTVVKNHHRKRRPDDGASTGKLYYHRSTGAFCP